MEEQVTNHNVIRNGDRATILLNRQAHDAKEIIRTPAYTANHNSTFLVDKPTTNVLQTTVDSSLDDIQQ